MAGPKNGRKEWKKRRKEEDALESDTCDKQE